MSLPSACPVALDKGWNPIFFKKTIFAECSLAGAWQRFYFFLS
jgi:hypothetical protein